jgi:hypothetical protein
MNPTPNGFTVNHIYLRLSERMSNYNARLALQSALLTSGITVQQEDHVILGADQAKAICLALINKGGPAFQVGKDLYRVLQ